MIKHYIYVLMALIQIITSATSYMPQIVRLIKRKSSDDISLSSWIMSFVDFATYQVLLICGNESFILELINGIQLVQIVIVIILVKIYRKNDIEGTT